MANHSRLHSDLAIPPGETLAEELEARGIAQEAIAATLEMPIEHFRNLIEGKEPVTDQIAASLAEELGISAQFWRNLEAEYRFVLARNKARRSASK